jgi:hypothetical protein
MAVDILSTLEGKWEDGTRPKDLYALHVSKAPKAYVATLIEGLGSKARRVQGGCAELCSLLSADHPELLAEHAGLFLANLTAKEPILRWEAACTVGNLAATAQAGRIAAHLDALIDNLRHESIVLQGHSARALGKVAKVNPKLAPKILEALFDAAPHFPGTRVGYLVEAAESFTAIPAMAKRIRELVTPYSTSELKPVATKARRVLKKLGSA